MVVSVEISDVDHADRGVEVMYVSYSLMNEADFLLGGVELLKMIPATPTMQISLGNRAPPTAMRRM